MTHTTVRRVTAKELAEILAEQRKSRAQTPEVPADNEEHRMVRSVIIEQRPTNYRGGIPFEIEG